MAPETKRLLAALEECGFGALVDCYGIDDPQNGDTGVNEVAPVDAAIVAWFDAGCPDLNADRDDWASGRRAGLEEMARQCDDDAAAFYTQPGAEPRWSECRRLAIRARWLAEHGPVPLKEVPRG